MPGYISAEQGLAVLPGLKKGSSSDVAQTAVDKEIDAVAKDMRIYADDNGYDLSAPSNHQLDLLAGVNSGLVEAKIILRRSTDLKPELFKYAQALKSFGKWILHQFRLDAFIQSWFASPALARVELCTVTEACAYVAKFTPSLAAAVGENKSYPWQEIIIDWIRWYSAAVYSMASLLQYPTPSDINTLPADLKETYSALVREIVGSKIVRIQKAQFSKSDINIEADELLGSGIEKLKALQLDENYNSTN